MLTIRQKLLDHDNQSAKDALETSSKIVIQKTTEVAGDLIGNKIANKINEGSKKIHNKIIQKQLQISMIKKYLKKDTYLQKKDKKLLMKWG